MKYVNPSINGSFHKNNSSSLNPIEELFELIFFDLLGAPDVFGKANLASLEY